jgi:outer membrane protein TolC
VRCNRSAQIAPALFDFPCCLRAFAVAFTVLAFVGHVSGQTATPPVPSERVTFQEAVDRAVKNNTSVAAAAAGILRAEGLLRQARAATLLQINGSSVVTTLNRVVEFGGQTVVPRTQVSATLAFDQPMVAAAAWARRAQAEDQQRIAELTVTDVRRQIALSTADAYLTVIAQRRVVEADTRARDVARAHFDLAAELEQKGSGSRLNALRAQQQWSTDEGLLESARLGLYRAQEALGVLIVANGPVDATGEPTFDIPPDALATPVALTPLGATAVAVAPPAASPATTPGPTVAPGTPAAAAPTTASPPPTTTTTPAPAASAATPAGATTSSGTSTGSPAGTGVAGSAAAAQAGGVGLLGSRTDLRLFAAEAQAAERVVRDTTKEWWPTVDALFQPQTLRPASLFAPSTTWQLFVRANVPIFDAGQRAGLRIQRQSQLDVARATLSGAETLAASQVRGAREAVASGERGLTSARAAADQAEQVVNITNVAFRAGAATNIEVIDAERSARDAETAVATAEDTLRRARLELLQALGRFPG